MLAVSPWAPSRSFRATAEAVLPAPLLAVGCRREVTLRPQTVDSLRRPPTGEQQGSTEARPRSRVCDFFFFFLDWGEVFFSFFLPLSILSHYPLCHVKGEKMNNGRGYRSKARPTPIPSCSSAA